MKIYFEDGILRSARQLPFPYPHVIEASRGITNNKMMLDWLKESHKDAIVYTNSLVAISTQYCWNERLQVPEFYVRAGEHLVFTRVDELTLGDFDNMKNILKVYIQEQFGDLLIGE